MQDKATLETIARLKLTEAGFEPLSPGTLRLAKIIAQAKQRLDQQLAANADKPIPF
jgi:hypothetical protein